jgi:PAS domain S-box-containing protein
MVTFLPEIKIDNDFIHNIPVPIAIVDKNLIFIAHSHYWSVEHNLDKESITGAYFFDIIKSFPTELKTILEHCLLGNSSADEGKKFDFKNGENLWLKWKINPWLKKDGKLEGLIIVLENITDKKEIYELVKDAQEVSRTGGWEVNLLNKTTRWTKMVNIIHEMPLEYVPRTFDENFVNFKEGEHRNKVLHAAKKAINTGISWDEEVLMITGTGKEIWARTKGRVEHKDGQCVRLYGTCQDIDQQKRAELQYRDSVRLLTNAVTASQVGTWEYNLENGHTVWDDVSFNLHEIKKNNYEGSLYTKWKNSIHPDDIDHVKNEASLRYKAHEKGIVEYRVVLPNGTIRFLKSTVTFISEANSSIQKAIGITQDVTPEKLAEIKLKEFAKITMQQNNSLTNFAHMVSHDLRAHSTNLSVLTSLLQDEKDENEKKQILEMLKKATNSLNSTVCNLNDVVLSTDSNITDKIVDVNILEAIHNVQNNISTLFKEKKGFCDIDVNKKHSVKVVPAYLDSILLNLFTNSLKYCSSLRTPTIKISSKFKGNFLELSFCDNGRGIDLQKFGTDIFGMNKTFHRNKDARGVGLYIIKNQIEAMGGTINVSSEVDEGTTFTILFKI